MRRAISGLPSLHSWLRRDRIVSLDLGLVVDDDDSGGRESVDVVVESWGIRVFCWV